MMIRFGLLAGMLAVGMTALPSNCYGFDGSSRRASTHCAAKRTDTCRVAPAVSKEAIALPDDLAGTLPLPRPPNLGRTANERPSSFCSHAEHCR